MRRLRCCCCACIRSGKWPRPDKIRLALPGVIATCTRFVETIARWDMSNEAAEIRLSERVQAAMRRNRKIEAIKILREEEGIGLKEAKDIIETQWPAYRDAGTTGDVRSSKMESGMGRIVWAVVVLAALYGLFRYFA